MVSWFCLVRNRRKRAHNFSFFFPLSLPYPPFLFTNNGRMKTRKKSFDVSADHQSNECGSMLTHQLVQTFKTAFSCFYEKKKEKPSFTAASQNYGEKEGASNHLSSASSCRRKAKLKKKNQFPTVYSNTDSFLFHDKNNPNNRQSCILSSTAASSSSSYFFVTPDYVNSLSFTETYNLKDIHDKFLKNLIQIRIENTPTKISEHENTVQYKTPNFRRKHGNKYKGKQFFMETIMIKNIFFLSIRKVLVPPPLLTKTIFSSADSRLLIE